MDASCSASDSDEELSVGGTTPPPPTDNMDTEEDTKSQEDRKDDVISGEKPLQPIRFSIENILNPEFGKTSPLVSAASTFLGSLNLGALPTSHPLGLFQANFSLFQQAKSSNNPLHPLNHVSPILSRNNNQLASSAIDLSLRNPSRSSPESSAPTQFRRQSTSPVNKLRNPSGSSSGSSVAGSQQVPTADDGGASGALKGAKLPEPGKTDAASQQQNLWPAWVYCTRYSDRPSSGRSPRMRRMRKNKEKGGEEKRPRTAFTAEQLGRLKSEFAENRYLTEKRRQDLARELHLHENQIKIWFQNKRAKIKKASGQKNPLALQLMAQGLYNHTTIPVDEDDDEDLAE